LLRKLWVKRFGKNQRYVHCYERTGKGWQKLFATQGLLVKRQAQGRYLTKWYLPPQGWHLYLTRPLTIPDALAK
jgi:hypothetical protein